MYIHKKIIIITSAIVAAIIGFISCINTGDQIPEDIRGNAYAGSTTCITCHKKIYDSYIHTAHHTTSQIATKGNIAGSFLSPANEFVYSDSMKVIMEKNENKYFQTAYIKGKKAESHSFDITIGSGRKGQTYLYYQGDEIYQLPVSYWVPSASWANSPGFPGDIIYFSRRIPSTCFGCHASAANVEAMQTDGYSHPEKYLSGQQLLGIDCERCHGPAKQHVKYHTEHPKEKLPKYIALINNKLTRTQKMDMCGVCHSGLKEGLKPIFKFKPGDDFYDFYYPDFLQQQPLGQIDVHGTQVQLLKASKCYQQSNNLTCISCHDPHKNENQNLAIFSQKCMTCHTEANHNFCTMKPGPGLSLKANCIDCHLPAMASNTITLLTNNKKSPVPNYIRTHLIAVYNEKKERVVR